MHTERESCGTSRGATCMPRQREREREREMKIYRHTQTHAYREIYRHTNTCIQRTHAYRERELSHNSRGYVHA